MRRLSAIAMGLLSISGAVGAAPSRPAIEHFGRPSLNGQALPFSDAVRVGDILYLSGQLGVGADGKLPDGIEAQTRQALDNVGAILKRAGVGYGDVFHCTAMLSDMKNWPAMNAVYVTYFPAGKRPARSAFGASGLALGGLIELECQAYAGKKSVVGADRFVIKTGGDDGLTQRFADAFRRAATLQQVSAIPLEVLIEQIKPSAAARSSVIVRYRRSNTTLETLRCGFAGEDFRDCVDRAIKTAATLS